MLTTIASSAQSTAEPSKDLWTRSVDVTLGDDWKQKTIRVDGKGEPDVVDFFRAFAKAYPCDYHDLLVKALDGDEEVKFCGSKPLIHIDRDSCFMENESFSMRVFYEKGKPAGLGVCCHKAITTELQNAYYYRYNTASRKLTPLAMGSDFTGGIVKRLTEFEGGRDNNTAMMIHRWGRCGIKNNLEWDKGGLVYKTGMREHFKIRTDGNVTKAVLDAVLEGFGMELRPPQHDVDPNLCGGSYNSLPICIAILDERSKGNYVAASAMEGYYYFYARGWQRSDGTMLVAIYTECAPKYDYDFHSSETSEVVKTPHKLGEGDEVSLYFYLTNPSGMVSVMNTKSPQFASMVGKNIPNLERNEWRCEMTPDNEDLIFVNEADGQKKVFRWNGTSCFGYEND